jgi:hypothetical protein
VAEDPAGEDMGEAAGEAEPAVAGA